ncbi:MAG TPA: hypothetical protein VFI23_10105 [Rhizomicrobium sp.]|nr:hypothetical protein [Rhizomicrobium sp.]
MPARKTVKVGDVLSIPIVDGLCATAQVLVKRAILHVVIFSELRQCGSISIEAETSSSPVLAGWTMDAKVYHGYWEIIGKSMPADWSDLKKNYKVEYAGKIWVEDFDGRLLHPASRSEIENLFNRSSYSPASLEQAIRAFHKLEPWDSKFDDLLIPKSNSENTMPN